MRAQPVLSGVAWRPDLGGPDLGGPDLGGPDLGGPDLRLLAQHLLAGDAEVAHAHGAPGERGPGVGPHAPDIAGAGLQALGRRPVRPPTREAREHLADLRLRLGGLARGHSEHLQVVELGAARAPLPAQHGSQRRQRLARLGQQAQGVLLGEGGEEGRPLRPGPGVGATSGARTVKGSVVSCGDVARDVDLPDLEGVRPLGSVRQLGATSRACRSGRRQVPGRVHDDPAREGARLDGPA